MKDFEFYNPTRIIFGKDAEAKLLYELRKYGKTVLFVYGGGSIKESGLYSVVLNQLREAGSVFYELSGVVPNPRVSLVRKGIDIVKTKGVDFILAVGGGSVIDTAKAIAVGALSNVDIWDMFKNHATATKALPLGVILTIPAAGSESSTGTVISDEESGLKRSIGGEVIIPRFAILNPERTYTLPAYQTACGASDIIAHLLERYFCKENDVDFVDSQIETCIKTMLEITPKVLKSPKDYNLRADFMWCGTVAHNNSLSVGRTGDWASHDMEHELSAFNDVAHGAGLAIIFPAYLKFMAKVQPSKVLKFAKNIFGVEGDNLTESQIISLAIDKFIAFLKDIELPTTLGEIGITKKYIELLSSKALIGRTHLGNYYKLSQNDVAEILKLAL